MSHAPQSTPIITVVYMGDSITEGQYVHHASRWTEIVTRRVRGALSGRVDVDQLHFFNRGISGETTRQGLERFPRDVQVLEPDVMTLQFGLNDCNCWDTDRGLPRVSELAYRANLMEMIARGRKFGARRIVLSTNHPTLRHRRLACGQSLEERRIVYNEIVRQVACDTGVILCDIEDSFRDLDRGALAAMLLPEPDVLHLSQRGHQRYADCIYSLVLEGISRSIEEGSCAKVIDGHALE
jgi:lysophospholipase L1-like esterase